MKKTAIVALVALLCAVSAARPAVRSASTEGDAASVSIDDTASVSIKDSEFEPQQLTVKTGTTVTWKNEGKMAHTVNADDGSFESPTLGAGKTFSRKFTEAGTYRYYCAFHGGKDGDGMSGTVVVTR
jgi:plastocyanin